jgi:hypothetical protein
MTPAELDALVAQARGWRVHIQQPGQPPDWWYAPPYPGRFNFHPATVMSDAWELVNNMGPAFLG